ERGNRLLAVLALVFLLDDAAHAKQAVGRRNGGASALAHLVDENAQLVQQGAIDAQRPGLPLRREDEAERNIAAFHAASGRGARHILETLETLGHPAADLEVAAVDATRLPHPAPSFVCPLRPGVSR